MGIFSKINFGLKKTRDKMSGAIDDLLDSFDTLSEDLYTELEEILVMGDVGVTTAVEITQNLRERAKKKRLDNPQQIKDEIKSIVAEMLEGGEDMGLVTVPSIILVIGVNGVGKTTTIGKMAAMYKAQGKKVILAAADTFRAAAIDQLQVWADRAGVDIVKHKEGADPAAVIFDTISAAKARESDIIICDTAGRLHNKKNLMDELAKIYRVIDRELPYSDREVLLVLDATTGQNAVNQAREFMSVAELTGIILTKLDGTARGGVVLSIKNELKIPVKFVGVGEKIDDLQPFDPKAFAEGLFESVTESEFPEDYALAEAENYEDSAIYTAEAEEIPEEAGADDKDIPEDEPAAAVEEEPADIDTADSEGNDEYTQSEESVVEEEEVKEDKKRRKGLFGIFSKK
ncbi:MAG: signal recognition particle-docking protein FtsY [Clostridiales bacterium]|nr:signal recognition particle-docking protein FtsY [Clostridiales bacterium]